MGKALNNSLKSSSGPWLWKAVPPKTGKSIIPWREEYCDIQQSRQDSLIFPRVSETPPVPTVPKHMQ